MEQQIKDAQTTAEQLTEDDSTLANTDDILPTDTDSVQDYIYTAPMLENILYDPY